jgi:Bax protein
MIFSFIYLYKLLFIVVIFFDLSHLEQFRWVQKINTQVPNFEKIKDVKIMKKTFFDYLAPKIEAQNQQIIQLRQKIKNNLLSQQSLDELYKKYNVKTKNTKDLLINLDIVPVSMALSQSAIESSWGRSRFAKYYYNFFGLQCFTKNCGLIPTNRDKDAKYEVRKFYSVDNSIKSYMLSINRNPAYKQLREIRKEMRDKKTKITGSSLAEGLKEYAEIGHIYVENVKTLIRQNKLEYYY